MAGRKKYTYLLSGIFILLISGFLLVKPVFLYISGKLTKSDVIKADALIVEGWLPDHALKAAYKEFNKNNYKYILTSGITSYSDYYVIAENGYLIFYTGKRFAELQKNEIHKIEIDSYSSMGGRNSANFNFFVNDSLIGDVYVSRRKKKYKFTWNGSLSAIDSLMIQFTNDKSDESGDRNLFVKDITIDHRYVITFLNNSEYDISKLDGRNRIVNNFTSVAGSARNTLLSMGMDSSSVIALPGKKTKINRTLNSAIAIRDWLDTSCIRIKGINVVSLGPHARRTWMTYKRVLPEDYELGIISLPDYRYIHSRKNKILKTIREIAGLVYYYIILLPY